MRGTPRRPVGRGAFGYRPLEPCQHGAQSIDLIRMRAVHITVIDEYEQPKGASQYQILWWVGTRVCARERSDEAQEVQHSRCEGVHLAGHGCRRFTGQFDANSVAYGSLGAIRSPCTTLRPVFFVAHYHASPPRTRASPDCWRRSRETHLTPLPGTRADPP